MEWHVLPQNALVPVTFTMICVPITATDPITKPATSSASTDHFALGVRSHIQVRFTIPGPGAIEASQDNFAESNAEAARRKHQPSIASQARPGRPADIRRRR